MIKGKIELSSSLIKEIKRLSLTFNIKSEIVAEQIEGICIALKSCLNARYSILITGMAALEEAFELIQGQDIEQWYHYAGIKRLLMLHQGLKNKVNDLSFQLEDFKSNKLNTL